MKTFKGIEDIQTPLKGCALTIGNFDGLHLGHRELIENVLRLSKQDHVPSVVFTFDPHPLEVLAPELNHQRLFSRRDLEEQLQQLGVDILVIQPFSKHFAKKSSLEFLEEYVLRSLAPCSMTVGHDFQFGSDRLKSEKNLEEFCMGQSIKLEVLDAIEVEGVPVSSSKVRQNIRLGNVAQASSLLGRNYYVEGVVVRGDGRGRQIGVPTINLQLSSEILPSPGVYVTEVNLKEQSKRGVSNIGCKPTFSKESDEPQYTFETHILDFDQDLYGEVLSIEFLDRLREEKKFAGKDDLVAQIQKDKDLARKYTVLGDSK